MSQSPWYHFFLTKMYFGQQKSTDLAAKHNAIDFGTFEKWWHFFLVKAHFTAQEAMDLAKQHLNKDLTRFEQWYFFFRVDAYMDSREAITFASKSIHRDLDQAKKVRSFLILDGYYTGSQSAKLAIEDKWYTIDFEAVKNLKSFFILRASMTGSESFKQAVECVHFDFEELKRRCNGLVSGGILKVVEEMKSEHLAREMAKLRVKQDTYRNGTKVWAYWVDRVNPKWNGWYEATIVSKRNDKWTVRYEKYPQWGDCLTNAEHVRFRIGAKVQAFWKDSRYEGWFPATVTAFDPKGYMVKYNDYPQWGDCQTDKKNVRN